MIIKTVTLPVMKQNIPYGVVENQHALLMPMGDIHFGVQDFPLKKFEATIKWAIDRGCMFIGMGEYLDFTSASQRNVFGGLRESVRQQIDIGIRQLVEDIYEVLRPTKGRWLGMLEGDHYWEFTDDHTSADQYLCKLLECDFLGTSAWIRVHPVKAPKDHIEADTIIYAHHGIGGSRKLGGHLNRVEDLLSWIDADLYLMGHSHAKIFGPVDYQIMTPDGVHSHRTRMIARTGGWLKGYVSHDPLSLITPAIQSRGTYVEKKAYPPSALGAPCFGIGFEKIEHSKYFKPAIHGSL